MKKQRKHDSKKLSDHIVGETKFAELGAKGAPVDNVNWDVKKGEVHSDPVFDPGVGPKLVIRRFNFQMPPGVKEKLTAQEILDYHKKNTVIPMLWKDELDLAQEPRIVAGKKGAFTIVAICAPRLLSGVLKSRFNERPELIHNIINDRSNRSRHTD